MRVVLTQPKIRHKNEADFAAIAASLRAKRFAGKADDVIVLPELIGEGLSSEDYLAQCRALAREFSAHVVGGSHFTVLDGEMVNQGAVVDPAGEVITLYQKGNPYGLERSLTPANGKAGASFKIGDTDCLVLVCADFFHTEAYRNLPTQPEIIFVPAFSVSRKSTPDLARARWRHAMIARAFEQAAYVAVSDWAYPVGKDIRPSSGVAGLAHPDPTRTADLLRTLGKSEVRIFDIDPAAGRLLREDQKARGFDIARSRQEQP